MEITLIILGLILDRATKVWASTVLINTDEIVIVKDFFSFSYLENRGAAFGIFQNMVLPLAVVTVIVLIVLIFYRIKYKPSSMVFKISTALIISGALGNLADRIYHGYVVDFVLFHYKNQYYFPTFNVADMIVVTGTVLMILYILKEESIDGKN